MSINSNLSVSEILETADILIYAVRGKHLSDLEKEFLEACCKGLKYKEIADMTRYCHEYINSDIAYKLWKDLSVALKENVKRSNFKSLLENYSKRVDSSTKQIYLEEGVKKIPYVERPALERQCYEELQRPGGLIRIKAPKKFGKTFLMDKLLSKLNAEHEYLTVSFNFLNLNHTVIKDLDQLLRSFCERVSHKLELKEHPSKYWKEERSSNSNCTYYFEDCILSNINRPLVIAFDNADRLFHYENIASEFFRMLRAWHEEANEYEIWGKFRIIIGHSTDVYIPMKINYSPFNVGLRVDLHEFNHQQVLRLAAQMGIEESILIGEKFTTLTKMVGGHPELVQRVFTQLSFQPGITLIDLMKSAATDEGIYEDHLWSLWEQLESEPDLKSAFSKVIGSSEPVELPRKERFLLNRLGLVVYRGNKVEPRNQLYRLYFQQQLKVE